MFQRQQPGGVSTPAGDRAVIASWLLTAAALYLILHLHLLTAFFAGLLVFELVHIIAPALQRHLADRRSRIVAVGILSTVIVGLFAGLIFGAAAFLRSDVGSVSALLNKMAEIVEGARGVLPAWMLASIPDDVDEVRNTISQWLRDHAGELRLAGAETGRAVVHALIGMIIGAMVSLHEAAAPTNQKPLAYALTIRSVLVGDAFQRVVFAQVRISALNTLFTAIYLVVVLRLFDIHLPYAKTLVAVTFFAGLLPVIGNLISNTVIVVVSLSVSLVVAIASLVFLIVIHKLEYFLNARIVGSRIHARPWELLIAMLGMEAAFGLPGVAAAPVYYAYLKLELAERGLV
jgi:predicted PurR-regulated permease PerM